MVEGKQFCGLAEDFPGLVLGIPLADFAVHKGFEQNLRGLAGRLGRFGSGGKVNPFAQQLQLATDGLRSTARVNLGLVVAKELDQSHATLELIDILGWQCGR